MRNANINREQFDQVAQAMVEAHVELLKGNTETANAYMSLVVGKAHKQGFTREALEAMNKRAKTVAANEFYSVESVA